METKDKIAACNICLLAQAMKDCPTCPFNPAHMKLTSAEREQVQRTELLKDANK